ncbi:MAG: bifunctional pantoate--beta-alanine ligase/(d)CMP kinase [Symploca sp. SIO2G7]|nr:bifunctional pantoate--beta-alanine ligase/(d)CMP kinase [Symploca sp. SIO2G7]
MRLFTTKAGLLCYLERHRQNQEVGLVPTMGSLHNGHLSLIERARQENTIVIVSIFVNPLQFAPTEDFQQYPRQWDKDRHLCEQVGVDVIFAPSTEEMLPPTQSNDNTQVIPPKEMISGLCGRSRPNFFQGVATIVTKLLNLVQPQRAYFGQKDAQQLAVIQRLVADLDLGVEIVPCPIVREESGLACSSRNQYLTESQKSQAPLIYRALQQAQKSFQAGDSKGSSRSDHRNCANLIEVVEAELAPTKDIQVEYVELVDPTTMTPLTQVDKVGLLAIAAHLGSTRLIDNLLLRHRKPIVAIDGPAGAGKSTVTRRLAKVLGLMYLDTGAMYRAITWRVMQAGIELEDEPAIAELVSQSQISLTTDDANEAAVRVWLDREEVTQVIRSPEVTANVSAIAAQPVVRRKLVEQQQSWGSQGGIVAEGRDLGTHVFPDAELKIFLTASVQERARRRQQDLEQQGFEHVSLAELEQDIQQRDFRDSTRIFAPLRKAADAIEVNTDGLSIAQVTDKIVSLYHQQLSALIE